MKKDTILRIVISGISIIFIIIHLFFPKVTIDGITLFLIFLSFIPWLAPLFKSLEFPGGWKIEFQDLQKSKEKAEEAGLLASQDEVNTSREYTFQTIIYDDPNLALAGLRIEIEKRLKLIAESNGIHIRNESFGMLMKRLSNEEILSGQEYMVLMDMTGLLNSAVHGASVDRKAVDWAMEVGPRLLKSLDEKIN
jgi:hypothetical protein